MRNFLLALIGTELLLFSCKKTDNGPSSGTGSINDGIALAKTKGSYWRYQRIDTTSVIHATYHSVKSDTSEELITLTGDTLINSIDPVNRVYVLLISNLTKGTLDTNFILYTKDRCAVYGHPVSLYGSAYFTSGSNIDSILIKPVVSGNWDVFVRFSLPASNSLFNMDTVRKKYLSGFDTTCTRVDTAISLPSDIYTNSVFVNHEKYAISLAPSGVGGAYYNYVSFIKPGIGFVYTQQTPVKMQGSAFDNVFMDTWFTRRLVSYKIL